MVILPVAAPLIAFMIPYHLSSDWIKMYVAAYYKHALYGSYVLIKKAFFKNMAGFSMFFIS